MQVLGQPYLESQDFQREVGLLQQAVAVLGVLGLDQRLEQVVHVPLDPLAQDEAVVAREAASVIAGPLPPFLGSTRLRRVTLI